MTTRIEVVNYGPQPVEVQSGSVEPKVIFPQQTAGFYVYKGQIIVVREQELNVPAR